MFWQGFEGALQATAKAEIVRPMISSHVRPDKKDPGVWIRRGQLGVVAFGGEHAKATEQSWSTYLRLSTGHLTQKP